MRLLGAVAVGQQHAQPERERLGVAVRLAQRVGVCVRLAQRVAVCVGVAQRVGLELSACQVSGRVGGCGVWVFIGDIFFLN